MTLSMERPTSSTKEKEDGYDVVAEAENLPPRSDFDPHSVRLLGDKLLQALRFGVLEGPISHRVLPDPENGVETFPHI